MKEIKSLEIVAGEWKEETTMWDGVLKRDIQPQAQLIFASLREVADAPEALKSRIVAHFGIPPFLLSSVCLESNGFSGFEPTLDGRGNLTHYNHWSRFVIKQTHDRLSPKPDFLRHHSMPPGTTISAAPVHGKQSAQYGWEWYEMGFFVRWSAAEPSRTAVLCCDVPSALQASLRYALRASGAERVRFSDPYSVFGVVVQEVISLYDSSVWAMRNHICGWEAARQQEDPDYPLLHEIARHAIHVSETLVVASESVRALEVQHRDFMALSSGKDSPWLKNYSPFSFSRRILTALHSRSESNKARLQNETQLSFHLAAQRDSKIQVKIADEANKETTAMKALAVITMTFLPATFVSSVFSTPFFQVDQAPGDEPASLTVSNHFWIYWALAIPLSILTFGSWLIWDAAWGQVKRRPPGNQEV
ncbi:uncharacterized protein DNG_05027 [Cephalotrichum gorgonifer]|uniref:CorA domain-containing protein n=1 Tax=Cephalotrichum gorgonifer TaxID=2041049 RepID=A0AAE8SVE9_9PEZI|nr:uncharacterized protein DNG_05027 [Cephalotrichum gorgonifer]